MTTEEEPIFLSNLKWFLREGVEIDPRSYLAVLLMFDTLVNKWLDHSAGYKNRAAVVQELHRLYFAYCDWSILWPNLQNMGRVAVAGTTSKRIVGLQPSVEKV